MIYDTYETIIRETMKYICLIISNYLSINIILFVNLMDLMTIQRKHLVNESNDEIAKIMCELNA